MFGNASGPSDLNPGINRRRNIFKGQNMAPRNRLTPVERGNGLEATDCFPSDLNGRLRETHTLPIPNVPCESKML